MSEFNNTDKLNTFACDAYWSVQNLFTVILFVHHIRGTTLVEYFSFVQCSLRVAPLTTLTDSIYEGR